MKLNPFAFALMLAALPAFAGTIYNDNGAIIIGPNGQWKPSTNCVPPTADAGTPARDAQAQAYKGCVEADAQQDMKTIQNNMAKSIQLVETDTPTSQNERDVMQREARSAAQRLGADH